MVSDSYSSWVFVVQLGSGDLFETTWVTKGGKENTEMG